MRLAAALALALGCYNPHIASDVPCNPSAPECPPGQQCVLIGGGFACSASPGSGITLPDAATDDDDRDGVPNGIDNCPTVFNPGQENEDQDAWGDACDLCPPYASTAQTDTDGDMVGDKCDPHPKNAIDHFLLFEGFHAGVPTSAGWTATGEIAGSGDSVFAFANGSSAAGLAWAFTQGGRETITTQFTLLEPGSEPIAAVVDTADTTASSGVACVVGIDSMGSGFQAIVELPAGTTLTSQADTITAGVVHQLAIERNGQEYECEDFTGGSTNVVGSTSTLTSTAPQLGILVNDAFVQFDWLMAVQSD